jgi:hypothetical protein
MGECQEHFSRYPVTCHTGYSGCACTGIGVYSIDPMDCDPGGVNNWLKLPQLAKGEVRNTPYENLSALYGDIASPGASSSTRLNTLREQCGVEYDPFDGVSFDLYAGFSESGLGGLIEDDCYTTPQQKYTPGFLPAIMKRKLPPDDCSCFPPELPVSAASSSSSS